MKHIIQALLFLVVPPMAAQQGNNWIFGNGGYGIDFGRERDSMMFVCGQKHDCRSNQSISNCGGKLMIYSTNNIIWNGQHQMMKDTLQDEAALNLMLPVPNDDSAFYFIRGKCKPYFYWHYHKIDLRWDNGRGNIDTVPVKITDTTGGKIGFIKHANDTDYWLLIKHNHYQVAAYRITQKGISTKPIKSKMLGTAGSGYITGSDNPYLRFSNNRKMVISPSTDGYPALDSARVYIYNFDNSTGLCSNQRLLLSYKLPSIWGQDAADDGFTFSPNDSFIYCQFGGPRKILQFETYANNIAKSCDTLINDTNKDAYAGYSPGMQLAPDNKIYYYYTHNNSSWLFNFLSVINYPDRKGRACDVRPQSFDISPFSTDGDIGLLFPCYNFPVKRINNKFLVTGEDGCGTDTLRFTFDGDSAFSYFRWYFGDGDSADGRSVVHQYTNAGSYYVRLACTLGPCGYRQWVGDSITFKLKPNLALQNIKSVYSCGKNELSFDVKYRYADTVHLWLNNKDTFIYDSSNSKLRIINYKFQTNSSGSFPYIVKALNAQCSDSVSYIHNVNLEPNVPVGFQTNNFASCGSSSFALSDTSGYDSIIPFRVWSLVSGVGGLDTVITTSQNPLNITLKDTGIYTIKLSHTTRQGCTDSLTKLSYISVFPLPTPVIMAPQVICYNDSIKITAPINSRYLWNNGDTNQSIYINKSGLYSVKVWNKYNCNGMSNAVKITALPPFNVIIKQLGHDTLSTQTSRQATSFLWLKDGQPFGNNTLPQVVGPASGSYSVEVTDSNGCRAKSQLYKYNNSLAPLSPAVTGLRLYPNPAISELYIDGLPIDNVNVSIIDILGRTVYQTASQGNPSLYISNINWPRGLYIVCASTSHSVTRMKVVLE